MKRSLAIHLLAGLAMLAFATPALASHGNRRPEKVRIGFEIGARVRPIRSWSEALPRESYRVWVPGRYEWRLRERTIPGRWVVVSEAPVARTVLGFGGIRTVVVLGGGERRVWEPGRTELVRERVWVPGHWEVRTRRICD